MMTDFDDLLVGMRYQYLRDATFHAFVEVIVAERYIDMKNELRDYRLAAQAEADQADELRERVLELERERNHLQVRYDESMERNEKAKVASVTAKAIQKAQAATSTTEES
jgi:hypothetical protein